MWNGLGNPYRQYFCGEARFQQDSQVNVSSLTRFRQRIGESECELTLQSTVIAGLVTGALKKSDLKRVTVDTTVQEKAVTYPTDTKMLNRVRASGEEGQGDGLEASPKLCSGGAEASFEGELLCACPSDEVDEPSRFRRHLNSTQSKTMATTT